MQFPYYIHLFGFKLHPHLLFELLAYSAGFQLYLLLRKRWPRREAAVPIEQAMWIIVGCVFGALAGSKLLAWVESFQHYWSNRHQLHIVLGGKTIVGGLLGGWVGVEIVKKRLGVTHSTGDLFVFPLILGMCIGRVGCFLTGLPDHTCGVHTSFPWAVDFGDGPRHPAQLYEIGVLLLIGVVLLLRLRSSAFNGELFRLFMLGYLSFRFLVEFIKPSDKPLAGLSPIQVACALGAGWCALSLYRGWKAVRSRPVTKTPPATLSPLVPLAEAE
jgi:phosphatidylglycerol:prolipoprotein diacylglycerol transferase